MFKIKFNDSTANATMTAEFDSYLDLVYFVADKKIRDEDFVLINFGDENDIVGIDGLCNYTKDVVNTVKEAQAALEAEYPEEDEDTFEDEDEGEEVESAFSEVFGDLDSLVY